MNDQSVAVKERWARKKAGQHKSAIRSPDRLPPGQRQVHNFPVLDLGLRPDVSLMTFLERDMLGFWELRGYSNTADPWSEERFAKKDEIPPGF